MEKKMGKGKDKRKRKKGKGRWKEEFKKLDVQTVTQGILYSVKCYASHWTDNNKKLGQRKNTSYQHYDK